jgi:beta-galactosidase
VAAYGAVPLSSSAALFANVAALVGPGSVAGAPAPATMEAMGAASGYALYSAPLPAGLTAPYSLTIAGAADYAVVFLGGGVEQGVVWRPAAAPVALDAALARPGAVVTILVENCGHLNYGRAFFDPKGLTGAVAVNGVALAGNWSSMPLPLDAARVSGLPFAPGAPAAAGPAFYAGTLTVAGAPADTYITLCGWGKGQVWINGFHVGRFWGEKGPQHSYYVPAALLRRGANNVTVFENLAPPANASAAASGYLKVFAIPKHIGAYSVECYNRTAATDYPLCEVRLARAPANVPARALN